METFCGSLVRYDDREFEERFLSKDFFKKEHNPSKYLNVLCYDFPRNSISMRKGEIPYDRDCS